MEICLESQSSHVHLSRFLGFAECWQFGSSVAVVWQWKIAGVVWQDSRILYSKRVTCRSWSDAGGMGMAQKIAENSVGVPRTCLAVTLYADASGHGTIAWGNCKLVQACFSPVVWCQGRCKGEYTDVGDRSLLGSLATWCVNDISWYH